MNQTNRADAAQKYLEAVGFTKPEPVIDVRPRMRFVNNLGVWILEDGKGVNFWGNELEPTYRFWLEHELRRIEPEDYNDIPAYERLVSKQSMVRTLVATGAGLLIIALAAFLCLGFR